MSRVRSFWLKQQMKVVCHTWSLPTHPDLVLPLKRTGHGLLLGADNALGGYYQGLSQCGFEDLEDQVMDYLVSVTDLKVFGCSIDFLQTATQTYLEDPIWDKLQQSMEYTIVFRDSSVILPSQEQLEGCPIYHGPLAVHVPMNPEEIVPEGAFAGVPRLRRVSVESGIRLIGAGTTPCKGEDKRWIRQPTYRNSSRGNLRRPH